MADEQPAGNPIRDAVVGFAKRVFEHGYTEGQIEGADAVRRLSNLGEVEFSLSYIDERSARYDPEKGELGVSLQVYDNPQEEGVFLFSGRRLIGYVSRVEIDRLELKEVNYAKFVDVILNGVRERPREGGSLEVVRVNRIDVAANVEAQRRELLTSFLKGRGVKYSGRRKLEEGRDYNVTESSFDKQESTEVRVPKEGHKSVVVYVDGQPVEFSDFDAWGGGAKTLRISGKKGELKGKAVEIEYVDQLKDGDLKTPADPEALMKDVLGEITGEPEEQIRDLIARQPAKVARALYGFFDGDRHRTDQIGHLGQEELADLFYALIPRDAEKRKEGLKLTEVERARIFTDYVRGADERKERRRREADVAERVAKGNQALLDLVTGYFSSRDGSERFAAALAAFKEDPEDADAKRTLSELLEGGGKAKTFMDDQEADALDLEDDEEVSLEESGEVIKVRDFMGDEAPSEESPRFTIAGVEADPAERPPAVGGSTSILDAARTFLDSGSGGDAAAGLPDAEPVKPEAGYSGQAPARESEPASGPSGLTISSDAEILARLRKKRGGGN